MTAHALRRARPENLPDLVYSTLKEDIAEFRLIPGDRFTETEIAERIGASRTPVRLALYRLQQEGFLEVHFRSGWQVRPFDFDRFDALYELRIVLEAAAVRRLCARGDTLHPELQTLKATWLVPVRARLTDGNRVALLDEAFHLRLVQATGNAEMAQVHRDVTDKIRIIRRLDFTQPSRVAATYAEHAQILRAILRHDADDAERLLHQHVDVSRAEVRKITLQMISGARRQW